MAEQGGPADGTLRALTNGVGSRHSAASRLDRTCCRSSVVERILGKAEVVSSILTGSTTQSHVSGIGETHPVLSRKGPARSEEHTSELQSLMRISYAVFCLKKKNIYTQS